MERSWWVKSLGAQCQIVAVSFAVNFSMPSVSQRLRVRTILICWRTHPNGSNCLTIRTSVVNYRVKLGTYPNCSNF